MLKIKESVDKKELEKFGFKKCKKPYECLYYRCFSRNVKVMYIGAGIYIEDWDSDDPRIHKNPNCKYRSDLTVCDMLFDLIQAGLVEKTPF